jgi:hypothetical protein
VTTRIDLHKAGVKKIALGEGVVEITLKALASDVDASREDLDEASAPTFFAEVEITGQRQQATLIPPKGDG